MTSPIARCGEPISTLEMYPGQSVRFILNVTPLKTLRLEVSLDENGVLHQVLEPPED